MSQAQLLPTVTPSSSLPPITYRGRPVVTTEMLAKAYSCSVKNIRDNFANNRERFTEGKHFYALTNGELKAFRDCTEIFGAVVPARTRNLTLWLERGAARHAKMLNTDKAWDVFELLEETFFSVVKPEPVPAALPPTLTPSTTSSRKPLEKLVKVWASQSGTPHAQCWTMLNAAFNLQSITELPEEWIPDAIIWVQGKIDALPKGLPEHKASELPQSAGRAAVLPGIPFSAAELAKLDALADRVEALNARFRVEHNALFKELVDLIHKRVTDNQFRMLSSLIWSSLERAVIAAPNILKDRCLFGDINPALLLKVLAASRS